MSKVWRRLQRVGKKATKFRFATHAHILTINCNSKWQPDKVCISWSRRERKISSKFAPWEPGLKNSYEGIVKWEKSTDLIEFDVTLYKGINDEKYEEKEWVLTVESEDSKGKRRLLATGKFNVDQHVSIEPTYKSQVKDLQLKTASNKIKSASISFFVSCQFLKEGKATDEDMISVASFMSNASSSSTNPYLNSNYLLNTKKTTGQNLKAPLSYLGVSDAEMNNDEDDEIDAANENNLDYYLTLQSKQTNQNYDSISFNFNGEPIKKLVTDDEIADNLRKDFEPDKICEETKLKKNETLKTAPILISESPPTPVSNQNTPFKTTSLTELKKDAEVTDEKTPFLNDIDSTNPFLSQKETTMDSKNPFLSPNLTESKESNMSRISSQESSVKLSPIRPNLVKPDEKAISIEVSTISDKSTNLESNKQKESISEQLNTSSTSKDLLDWCKEIIHSLQTKKDAKEMAVFTNLYIRDFSKSWKNGLAFCAVIYYFRPDLIDLNSLSEEEPRSNLKQAFSASDSENIVRVVDYGDILNKENLDQLFIMTYLFQLRDHFEIAQMSPGFEKKKKSFFTLPTATKTNLAKKPEKFASKEVEPIKQSKNTSTPIKSNTMIPASAPITRKTRNFYRNPFDDDEDDDNEESEANLKKELKKSGLLQINSNGEIFDVEERKTAETESLPTKAPTGSKRLSRRESLNKSSSSSASSLNSSIKKLNDGVQTNKASQPLAPNGAKEANSSEELIQKAKELIEKTKQSNESGKRDELNQKVKQILAETKNKTRKKSSSSSSTSSQSGKQCATPDEISFNEQDDHNNNKLNKNNNEIIGAEYVNQELLNLRKEQRELDERGASLEKQLRSIMVKNSQRTNRKLDKEKDLEEQLLKEWFLLINRKNALLHRQQELEILQNEKDLEKRYEILSNKLRNLMQIEEVNKTDEQKRIESILLNELINNVKKRNELVLQLDEENKLLNEGEIIADIIKNRESFQTKEKACLIQ